LYRVGCTAFRRPGLQYQKFLRRRFLAAAARGLLVASLGLRLCFALE
jgi:hypothetical protein